MNLPFTKRKKVSWKDRHFRQDLQKIMFVWYHHRMLLSFKSFFKKERKGKEKGTCMKIIFSPFLWVLYSLNQIENHIFLLPQTQIFDFPLYEYSTHLPWVYIVYYAKNQSYSYSQVDHASLPIPRFPFQLNEWNGNVLFSYSGILVIWKEGATFFIQIIFRFFSIQRDWRHTNIWLRSLINNMLLGGGGGSVGCPKK